VYNKNLATASRLLISCAYSMSRGHLALVEAGRVFQSVTVLGKNENLWASIGDDIMVNISVPQCRVQNSGCWTFMHRDSCQSMQILVEQGQTSIFPAFF